MRLVPLALGAALLGGCATFDAARGHDTVASVVSERIGAETGWGAGAPDAEPLAARVDALVAQGLTAERAVAITLINNPSLQATYESLGVSQADMIQAGLLENPSLSLDVGFPVTPGAIVEMGVSVVQEFVDLFMLPLKKKVAEEQFVADVLRVSHEALGAAAIAEQEVLALQAAEQLLELQRIGLAALEASSDLSGRQHRAGNITELALAQRTVAYEQLRTEVANSELAIVAHRERINRQLGLWGPRTDWKLAEPLAPLPAEEPTIGHLESLAVGQRLDLAAARKQVSLLETGLHLARTFRYVGSVEVGAHTHQDPDGPLLIGPDLTLELPIFDQRQAVIGRLESQLRQAQRRLQALSVNARSEVREAQARLLTARSVATHFQEQVLPLRQRVLDETLLQYNGMQLSLYDLVDAKREQLEAQERHLESLRDYWIAHTELERLVGGRVSDASPAAEATTSRNVTPPTHSQPAKEGANDHANH